MRRFYAPKANIGDNSIVLDTGQTRHLRDVLRLAEGESVNVFDGLGNEIECQIESIEKKGARLKILRGVSPSAPESPLHLTLAAALMKSDKFDFVVQKAVELGVSRIIPLNTTRCDVRLKDNAKRRERWQKIAIEAAKQSGRARITEIGDVIDFGAFVRSATPGSTYLFSERNGGHFETVKPDKQITAIVGPEGGWDDDELELASNLAMSVVTLGGRILRTETAAISITAIIQHRFGDIN